MNQVKVQPGDIMKEPILIQLKRTPLVWTFGKDLYCCLSANSRGNHFHSVGLEINLKNQHTHTHTEREARWSLNVNNNPEVRSGERIDLLRGGPTSLVVPKGMMEHA